jgi:hypothetical protein
MSQVATQFAISLVASILTALITVWLSLRRFYAEKWWERKLDAYTAIIEALHRLAYPFNEFTDDVVGEVGGISEERKAEVLKRFAETFADLRRQADVGRLVISDEALHHLDDLVSLLGRIDPEEIGDSQRRVTLEIRSIYECLNQVQRIAKEDLRLARGNWLPGPLRWIRERFVSGSAG